MISFRWVTSARSGLASVVGGQPVCGWVLGGWMLGGWVLGGWILAGGAPFYQHAWGQAAPDAEPVRNEADAIRKEIPPLPQLPLPKPKRLQDPQRLAIAKAATKPPAQQPANVAQPAVDKPARQPLPANRRRHSPFWSPRQTQLRQGNLSRASVYQLESLGRHVHLTPAMRWHLNRSGGAGPSSGVGRSGAVGAPRANSSAANAAGQRANKFYPGVSRLPAQKPFANLERPATGFERYWPLLLEGREDPNTGLIIWSLP